MRSKKTRKKYVKGIIAAVIFMVASVIALAGLGFIQIVRAWSVIFR